MFPELRNRIQESLAKLEHQLVSNLLFNPVDRHV
jgi:hypothetical protein